MSRLVCRGISRAYGGKKVLHQVDLELESGNIYGLLGRNGAGKTTLLSVLAAQNPATEGTVCLDGEEVWENQKVLDRICFSRELNPAAGSGAGALKVKEYFRMAAAYLPGWDRKLADRLVEEFGLDMKKRIGGLSKGMMSMITIIVALASKAEFTFLDEPAAGLDVVAREKLYRILVEEFSDTGRTFVVSTHIIEEASDIFDEVLIMDQGLLILKENTQELLERAWRISGLESEVDQMTASMETYQEEVVGRSKGVTVLLPAGKDLPEGFEVSLQKPSLQKLFAAMCGKEEPYE